MYSNELMFLNSVYIYLTCIRCSLNLPSSLFNLASFSFKFWIWKVQSILATSST